LVHRPEHVLLLRQGLRNKRSTSPKIERDRSALDFVFGTKSHVQTLSRNSHHTRQQ
jgi:hypothetical protein